MMMDRLMPALEHEIAASLGKDYRCELVSEGTSRYLLVTGYQRQFSVSKTVRVFLRDDSIYLQLMRYNHITWDAWANRTEELTLSYENPMSVEWLMKCLRRFFCLDWGNELKPWD